MLQLAINAMLSFVLGVGSSTTFIARESYQSTKVAGAVSPEVILVGSTPGDDTIKSMLGIGPTKGVDFIRLHILLNEDRTFVLSAAYGVGKPNTPDFEGGGETLSLKGSYAISKEHGLEIYKLTGIDLGAISIAKLNDNVFHILSSDGRLMARAGGWGYTLSRMRTSSARSAALPSFARRAATGKMQDETVYVGRTPCAEIAAEYKWPVGDQCSKLKWKLTLFRDPKTGQPTTYNLQRTLHRSEPIEGKWAIVTGADSTVYRLDPDNAETSFSFLVGDENVLFFLDKENRLFGANADFSYTLNRRID